MSQKMAYGSLNQYLKESYTFRKEAFKAAGAIGCEESSKSAPQKGMLVG
jgi:hypothetical protein